MNKKRANRSERTQKPLGELLIEARHTKNLSRAELAKLTDIGENSIVRYEKCGIEEGGQYPPANKLATLAMHLDIPSSEILWSSLDIDQYDNFEASETVDDLLSHPGHMHLSAEYHHLLQENASYREALRILLSPGNEHQGDALKEMQNFVSAEALKLIDAYDTFERRMLAHGIASVGRVNQFVSAPADDANFEFSVRNGERISFIPHKNWFDRAEKQISNLQTELEHLKEKNPGSFPTAPGSISSLPDQRKEVDDG